MTPSATDLLVGVVEPTVTTLARYTPAAPLREPVVERAYPHTGPRDLALLVHQFLHDTHVSPEPVRAIFVIHSTPGHDRAPDGTPLVAMDCLVFPRLAAVTVLSPMDAYSALLPHLLPDELHALSPGRGGGCGPLALLLAGPVFEQATLTWHGTRYDRQASEGGTALVAPTNYLEQKVLTILQGRFGQVQYGHLCSCAGIVFLYDALKQIGVADEPEWLTPQLAQSVNPVSVILQAAQQVNPACTLCTATVEQFLSLLGTAAAAFALSVRATGGVYIGGTLLPRLTWMLDQDWFRDAFYQHGVGGPLLHSVPVTAIVTPKAALLGAAAIGLGLA